MNNNDSYFQTYSNKEFYILDPRPEDIDIVDIAHALSNQCRFNGHVNMFYSVAEHSVLVSNNLPDELKLWGLLHDASEAYMGDMVRPLKNDMPKFLEAEENLMWVIADKYNLEWPMPKEVTLMDNIVLATEKRDIKGPAPRSWGYIDTLTPLDYHIQCWPPFSARKFFLETFYKLETL
jgi:hypothetical protein